MWLGTAFHLGWCFLELCLRISCSHVLLVTCSGTTVKLASRGHEEVVIAGIDEYGYLRVQCKNGQELSLQPDGNTFDIMKGLIAMK